MINKYLYPQLNPTYTYYLSIYNMLSAPFINVFLQPLFSLFVFKRGLQNGSLMFKLNLSFGFNTAQVVIKE